MIAGSRSVLKLFLFDSSPLIVHLDSLQSLDTKPPGPVQDILYTYTSGPFHSSV